MNQFQVEIFKQRAVGGHVPGLFSAMTDRADARTGKGPVPVHLDGFDRERRDPFKWIRPFLSRFVDGNGGCAGAALPWSLSLGVDELKFIVVFHVGNNRIDRRGRQILVARSKLIQDVGVTRVQRTDEDHDQQERRDDHLATGHIQEHAVEARAKLHNRLRIPLNVVEK